MIGAAFAAVAALGAAGQFASGLMARDARQAEFAEQLRQLKLKKEQTLGLARARAAASGVLMSSGSTVGYLAGLSKQFDSSIRTLKKTKRTSGLADLVGGGAGLVGAGASIYGQVGQMNNWWGDAK